MNEQYVVLPHTGDYHSVTKRDEVLPLTATWMDLEDMMLSERSQTQDTHFDFTHRRSLEVSDPETGSWWWGQGLGEGMGSQCFMGTEFQFGKMRKSGDDWGRGCMTVWMCLMPLSSVLIHGYNGNWYILLQLRKGQNLYSVYWVCLNQPMLEVTFRKVCTYLFLIHCSPLGGKKEVNGEEGKASRQVHLFKKIWSKSYKNAKMCWFQWQVHGCLFYLG